MKSGKYLWAVLGSGSIVISMCTEITSAAQVSLPFFEPFNNLSANATVDYAQFTAQQAVGGPAAQWTVDAKGLRTSTVAFANLDEPAFSVTPNPKPTGEIVINVDIGWNNLDVTPISCIGCGGAGLRLGRHLDTLSSENTMLFHPGYNGPPGSFRINGPGGDGLNWNMGWTPALDVLHHVEIHSFPDGLFNIKVTDGTDPNLVYEDTFTNPAAYGGDIGLLAAGGGAAIYKNLSIVLANPPPGVPGDYNANGVVDTADYVLWRNGGPLQNEVDNPGVVDAGDYSPWRERFGNTSGSGSALGGGGAVPEPATLVILSTAGALLFFRRRKFGRSAIAGGATNSHRW
jgi:hypothetical protein